jgi:hypothetical protein
MEELTNLNIDQLRSLLYFMISNDQRARDIFNANKQFMGVQTQQQNAVINALPQQNNATSIRPKRPQGEATVAPSQSVYQYSQQLPVAR